MSDNIRWQNQSLGREKNTRGHVGKIKFRFDRQRFSNFETFSIRPTHAHGCVQTWIIEFVCIQ